MPIPSASGASEIEAWWGEWPDFHDHELLEIPSSAGADGAIRIRGWVTDWHATDVRGNFKTSKYCVVTIGLKQVRSLRVEPGQLPAILFELWCAPDGPGWVVRWTSSCGPEGTIEAEAITFSLEPESERPSAGEDSREAGGGRQ